LRCPSSAAARPRPRTRQILLAAIAVVAFHVPAAAAAPYSVRRTPDLVEPGRGRICREGARLHRFEPMAGITDALNLASRGRYRDLQHIPPGDTWSERFWIRPSGF
jgi:hypothetical protein